MSYRHSSYRKLRRAAARALRDNVGIDGLSRHESNRIRHWVELPPRTKPAGWGKPKAWRA